MSTNASGTRLITQKHEKAEEIARSFTGLEAGDDRFLVIRILRDIGTLGGGMNVVISSRATESICALQQLWWKASGSSVK